MFFKKHTGKTRLEYDDAVEETICFGWIVGTAPDGERYTWKFTPRSHGSGGWPSCWPYCALTANWG